MGTLHRTRGRAVRKAAFRDTRDGRLEVSPAHATVDTPEVSAHSWVKRSRQRLQAFRPICAARRSAGVGEDDTGEADRHYSVAALLRGGAPVHQGPLEQRLAHITLTCRVEPDLAD